MTILKKFIALLKSQNGPLRAQTKEQERNSAETEPKRKQLTEEAKAFHSLVSNYQHEHVYFMLKKGYQITPQNLEHFFSNKYNNDYAELVKYGQNILDLFFDTISRSKNPEQFIFEHNTLISEGHYGTGHDQLAMKIEIRNELFRLKICALNFDNLDFNEKVKIKRRMTQFINYLINARGEIIVDKEFCDVESYRVLEKKMDIIIKGGLANLMENGQKNSEISSHLNESVKAKLSPKLALLIEEIENRVRQAGASNIEIPTEKKLIIKRIMSEDIPLMASNVTMLPQDLQTNFTNKSGQDINGALLTLLNGYRDAIFSIIDEAELNSAARVHKQIEINTAYIQEVRRKNSAGHEMIPGALKLKIGKN